MRRSASAGTARVSRASRSSHGVMAAGSCHGASASQDGKHASTGKVIRPLAPGFNPERLTDPSKVEKWFKRNCKDVLERECSASEKADVMAWLISVKP